MDGVISMISFFITMVLLNSTVPVCCDTFAMVDSSPLVFPEAMPPAANAIIAIPQDLSVQDNSWWASAWAFLGNNSTNLTNSTGLFYA